MTPEFDPSIVESLRRLRQSRGECPAAEQLTAFAEGSLAEPEATLVERHVERCGLCDSVVVGLRGFAEDAADLTDEEWRASERRIGTLLFPPKPSPGRRVAGWLWNPVAGYALAACACVVLVVASRSQPAKPGTAWLRPAESIDLRGTRSAEGQSEIGLFVVLTFFVPMRPDWTYEASIDGRAPRRIAGDDGQGNVAMAFPAAEVAKGPHRLVVKGVGPGGQRDEWPFEFEAR